MERTHGMSMQKSGLYRIWGNIKQRCTNPNNTSYKNYGGRGITLCKRWYKFENFLADLKERPEGMTLDRINNNKGYSPNNVRWVTIAENTRNTRRCVMVKIKGVSKPINVWCREFGVPYTTFKQRRRNGWDLVKAVSTLPDARRRKGRGNDAVAPNGKTLHIKD